jgi:hypothetical protein
MTGPENDRTDDEVLVRRWRFEQLVANGYSLAQAAQIAHDCSIDLELARRLVSKLGCRPDLATTILV